MKKANFVKNPLFDDILDVMLVNMIFHKTC